MKRFALFAGAPLLLGLCCLLPWGQPAARAQAPDGKTLAKQAKAVLAKHCAKCHGEDHMAGTLDVLIYKTLITPGKKTTYIVPKDLKKSYAYQRIMKNEMPEDSPVPDGDKEVLTKWIEAGAPDYDNDGKAPEVKVPEVKVPEVKAPAPKPAPRPAPLPRTYISHKDVLLAILYHLQKADHEDRPYLRYFTLAHLYNDPTMNDEKLGRIKAGLCKALNSMHWKKNIVIPQPVSKDNGAVLWIDLRDLDWDRKGNEKVDRWYVMLRRYPYGIDYENSQDDALVDADKEINKLTRHTLVHMRADWFVSQACRPPLYEQVLRLPKNAAELEYKLGVDVYANFKRNRMWRAGFVRSGVSTQNRLIERHDQLYGAYWKSYDFKRNKDQSNLVQLPLGPEVFLQFSPPSARSPHGRIESFKVPGYEDVAFKQDGGEVVFSLPNGLQGYYLCDGKDNYIPEGPTDVVRDKVGEFSGGPEIVNGLSCMCCHAKGLVEMPPAGDEIRDGSALVGKNRKKVRKLYPPVESMVRLMDEDDALFLRSVAKATLPFLLGEERDLALKGKIDEVGEPIRDIVKYYNPDVKLARAAYELGFKTPDELRAAINGNPNLQELGLATLVRGKGGSVKLTDWHGIEGNSLYHKAARYLGIGTARKIR